MLNRFMVVTAEGVALNVPPMSRGITVASVVAFLQENPKIVILSLPMNDVNDEHIAEILQVPTLLKLNVYGNNITAVGAGLLANSNLLSLTITNNKIGDVGAAALANSKLKTLMAANCDISDVGASAFKHNKTIESLDLSENEKITQYHFADNVRLCSVDLRETNVVAVANSEFPLQDSQSKVPSLQYYCLLAMKRQTQPTDPNVLGLELTGKEVLVRK